MRSLTIILFCFLSAVGFGQGLSLGSCFQLFNSADVPTIKSMFQNSGYQQTTERDSLNYHLLKFEFPTSRTAPTYTFFLLDSAVEFLSIEHYDLNVHKAIAAQLKAHKFKVLNADVNGDFITTSYDNGTFILNQDYQAVENPNGKGQIPFYRYRMVRKRGVLDMLNGVKKETVTINGTKYFALTNYQNGMRDGERIIYYPGDSMVKRKENYRAGRLNGTVSDYNEKGQLIHSSVHSYHWKYGMEKWYNNERKVVKSLQWQRDIPVGIEKQTYNGTVVQSIPYVKGQKQGLAKVAIYYDQHIQANYPRDTLNDQPFAIENVNFVDGLKEGKAVCIYFNEADTMYVAYYKNGKLDSTYNRYGANGILYTTNYTEGLENGTRVYRIPNGPLKDSVYQIENYKNGKLNGQAVQYYRKTENEMLVDPDPGFHMQGYNSGYPKTIPGEWTPLLHKITYRNGKLHGPFVYFRDSSNYNKGTYTNGTYDGPFEAVMTFGERKIKQQFSYEKGVKNGLCTTETIGKDTVTLSENYNSGKKHGASTTMVNGKRVEERHYVSGYLYEITEFTEKGFDKFTLVTNEVPDLLCVKFEQKIGDQFAFYHFTAKASDFPETDSTLALFKNAIGDETEAAPRLNGKFEIKTPNFVKSGNYLNSEFYGLVVIEHKKAGVYEQLTYENGAVTDYGYTSVNTSEAYSGKFIAATDGSSISVKDGKRHGWTIESDETGKEIRRIKYVKGIRKKVIENSKI